MIVAAADGSSLSNPGPAGWAWYVDERRWAAGGWPRATNNAAELMAVLDLLRQTADTGAEVHVLCDSQYVINALTRWLPGWKRKGWRKADGKPVLNVELLQELDGALAGRKVTFEWVKGHAGHALNEAADDRARAAAAAFQRGAPVSAGPGWSPPGKDAAGPADTQLPTHTSTGGAAGSGAGENDPPANLTSPWAAAASELEETVPDALVEEHDVVAYQRAWLSDEVRADLARADQLLHARFVEHDSSGRVSGKGRTLATLRVLPAPVTVEVLGVEDLAPWVVLLRWRSRSASGNNVCASVWTKRDGRWQLRFEQRTDA